MAEYKITLTISETDQKILSNDLKNKADNVGITTWIENALKGKISIAQEVLGEQGRDWLI